VPGGVFAVFFVLLTGKRGSAQVEMRFCDNVLMLGTF
jgi:hypothetical protein